MLEPGDNAFIVDRGRADVVGFMWSSGQPVAAAIKAGYAAYTHRHCHYPTWCRLRMEARQELTEQDLIDIVSGLGLLIVTVTTVPPQHYLFGVNGGAQDEVQSSAAVAPERPCNSCNMGSESERGNS